MKQIDFEHGKITDNILRASIPMLVAEVLSLLYNIVDRIYIARIPDVGTTALGAVGLCFPIITIILAFSNLFGSGGAPLFSIERGRKDTKESSMIMNTSFFLICVCALLLMAVGMIFAKPILLLFGSSENGLIYAYPYLMIYLLGTFPSMVSTGMNPFINAQGNATTGMVSVVSGAVANIILDPIMIFGLLGCPKFGVKGAAYATVIGQIISLAVAFIFHIKFNKDITNNVKNIKPSANTILNIYKIGLPAIIAQALMSVMTYGFNLILDTVSEAMVTAYGLYYKIQQFILFAAFGLRDAITPIMSYAFGMKSKKRIDDSIKFGSIYTTVIMFVGLAVIEIIANPLSSAFGLSGETQLLCIGAMRIVSASFIFAGINIAFQGMFQAINGGMQSLIVSVCRQLVLVLPLAWIFTVLVNKSICGEWIIWLSVPVAEILSAVISVVLMKKLYQKQINNKTEA